MPQLLWGPHFPQEMWSHLHDCLPPVPQAPPGRGAEEDSWGTRLHVVVRIEMIIEHEL